METKYQDSRVRHFSITIGNVKTLPAGSEAKVINRGTVTDLVLDFYLPRGDQGFTGASAQPLNGRDGVDGKNGLSASEIESVITQVSERVVGEFKKAADQAVANIERASNLAVANIERASNQAVADFKAKLDQAIKSL